MYIQNDNEFKNALSQCSPNIVTFLNGLNNGTAEYVDFVGLRNSGLIMSDGTLWRVVESQRTYKKQAEYFEQGRKFKKSVDVDITGKGQKYNYNNIEVKNKTSIVTNKLPGTSKHNYGLAVDLVFRKIGYEIEQDFIYNDEVYTKGDLDKFYVNCGLLFWASACGLFWGGNWSDFRDVVHFEEKNIDVPKNAKERYSNEMGFDKLNIQTTTNNNSNNSNSNKNLLPFIIVIGSILFIANKK